MKVTVKTLQQKQFSLEIAENDTVRSNTGFAINSLDVDIEGEGDGVDGTESGARTAKIDSQREDIG